MGQQKFFSGRLFIYLFVILTCGLLINGGRVKAAAAAQLTIATYSDLAFATPAASYATGDLIYAKVAVQDGSGNPDLSFDGGTVSITPFLNSDCTGAVNGILFGTTGGVSINSGEAAFTDIYYDTAETIYLQASDDSGILPSVCSAAITIGAVDPATALANATAAVETAETSHLQADVDTAQRLVALLPAGTDKDALQLRIDAVQAIINAVDVTISGTTITGVAIPATDATPATTATATNEYTATVSWNGNPATFAAGTSYTATITLTPTAGYTLTGVTANQFTVAGAAATNSPDSGVVTAVFPATAARPTVLAAVESDGRLYVNADASPTLITITFNEGVTMPAISIAPDGGAQTVNDCGDSDAASWCFNYALPSVDFKTETITISGAQSLATGAQMAADPSHTFDVDTTAPSGAMAINSNAAYTTSRNVNLNFSSVSADVNQMELGNGASGSYQTPVAYETPHVYTLPDNGDGTYYVRARLTDSAGNKSAGVIEDSIILDTTPPVITLIGSNAVNVAYGSAYADDGATASDNIDGNITASIIPTGLPLDTGVLGQHTITYNVSDAAGNAAASVTRTVNVVQRNITVTAPFVAKTYDQGVTAAGDATYDALAAGDVVNTAAALTFDSKIVGNGNKVVTPSGMTIKNGAGADMTANYNITYVSNTASTITALHITGGFTAGDKVYDGTNSAIVTGRSLVGVIGGDDVSLSGGNATFIDETAANGKAVSLIGASLTGADANNYALDSAADTTANITPAPLTIAATAGNKIYDGSTAEPAFTLGLAGKIGADDVSAIGGTAAFADPNVGSGIVVAVSGYTLSGAQAGNYAINNATAAAMADITPADLTITANNNGKTYGDALAFSGTEFTTSGLLGSDGAASVTLTSDGAAASAAATGSPYAIIPSAAIGGGLNNYNINYVNGALTVNKRSITVTAQPATKIVNAPTEPALNYNITSGSLVGADTFTGSLTRAGGESIGAYAITQGTLALNDNYTLTYNGADLTIIADPVTTALTGISDTLNSAGIVNNLNEVTTFNQSGFPNLYFEKRAVAADAGTAIGRITFNSALNLSNGETQAFLQNLGAKMDANSAGTIGLDFTGATSSLSLMGVSATVKFYGLNALGFTATSTADEINAKLTAFDDSGNLLTKSSLVPAAGTYLGACEVGGGCYVYTVDVNHFTKYKIDTTPPTVTKLGDNSADAVLTTGDTDLVFNEVLSDGSKTAAQNALTAGADKALTYAWTGAALKITAAATTTFINDVMAHVSDTVGNAATLLLVDSLLNAGQTAPDTATGNASIDSAKPEVVITDPDKEVNITVNDDAASPKIDVSSFISGGTGTLPAINITSANANNAGVAIPAATIVTSNDAAWDGIIAAPTITSVSLPETEGQTTTLSAAIELGYSGGKLSFDKAVRILLPGQAGKRAGYIRTGISFTEITAGCAADNQAAGNALSADSECKIDSGPDLVIWTKHFTSFAAYSLAAKPAYGGSVIIPAPVGGGGGGVSSSPSPQTQETTVRPSQPAPQTQPAPELKPRATAQVLGEKTYADGSLLRGPDKKIFLIVKGAKMKIASLNQLAKYRGQKIYDVAADVLAAYQDYSTAAGADENYLVRTPDKKIYAIVNGLAVRILNLAQLKLYAGKKITEISFNDLASYLSGQAGESKFPDGALIRGKDKKIYLIQNNKLIAVRNLAQLARYKNQIIHDVADSIIRQYMVPADGE